MKLGNPKTNADVQMSEAFVTSVFLALSGGFQDAYTYFTREEVFSNAQTGNIVLMSTHLMMGEWLDVLRYLLPLLAFASGVFFAEKIHVIFKYAKKLHWRQGVLLMEIAILVFVGFMPKTPGSAGYRAGIVCMCNAGTDVPESKRIFLCKHNVHRKSS